MTNENETNEQQDLGETILWYNGDIPWTVDDELNYRTGTPHWRIVVDEMEQWASEAQVAGVDTVEWDDLVPIGVLIYAVEQLGKALEKSIVEANNLRSKLKALNEMNKALRQKQSELDSHIFNLIDWIALDPERFDQWAHHHSEQQDEQLNDLRTTDAHIREYFGDEAMMEFYEWEQETYGDEEE